MSKREVNVFPVQDWQFALYIQHWAETTESGAALETAVKAKSWEQQMAGLQPISSSLFVHTVLAGLEMQLAKPKAKKSPITSEMSASIVQSL